MTTSFRTIAFGVLAWVAVLAVPSAEQLFLTSQDTAALQQWTLNIEGYQAIRDQAAQAAPPPQLPMSAAELLRAEAAFAAELRARRTSAQAGDLFTPEVQRTFRKLIARAITDHQVVAADLVCSLVSDILTGSARPTVNQRFPWQLGTAMPACLIAALPELPKGIQYRLVGRDLILLDLDANLVIDILPEALPRPAVARPADAAALQEWTLEIEEYLVVREQAARTVPLPRVSPDSRQVLEARGALASAIRDRRAGAKIGDLFTFAVRRTFRELIARSLTEHQIVTGELLAELRRQIGPGSFVIGVNEPFPWQLGAAVPSCVLDALPPLPWELEYRIIDHDVVLIDQGSGLVIDILPDALPRPVTIPQDENSSRAR
jgi:hypothetical protein